MNKSLIKRNQPAFYLLLVSLFSSMYILFAQQNVYKYVISGVFFELFWLPILLSLIIVPVVSIILWIKKGWKIRSPEFATIIISVFNLILMFKLN